jgi:GNAT superfamily N-acetyltransferase
MEYRYIALDHEETKEFEAMTYPYYRLFLKKCGKERNSSVIAIGAKNNSYPLGLALTKIDKFKRSAQLLSLFVIKEYRGQGIGKELVQQIQKEISERRLKSIKVIYEKGFPYTGIIEKILDHFGYAPYTARALVCRADMAKLKMAPWLKIDRFPEGFEIGFWKDITPKEKKWIYLKRYMTFWYPRSLSPFQEEDKIEFSNSLILRKRDKIVGWMITHRISSDIIRYSALFIKKEYRYPGLAYSLITRAIRYQVDNMTVNNGPTQATCMFLADNKPMIKFAKKRLAAYLEKMDESVERVKLLQSH